MDKKKKSLEYFRKGYNCAQSTFLPFAGNNKTNTLISSGFGGGMGRLQKTCGAVTGAYMALGKEYGAPGCPDEESKLKLYSMIQEFNSEFIKVHGSDQCRVLLGADMNTDEGKKFIKENNLHSAVCEKCIITAVSILEKYIPDK